MSSANALGLSCGLRHDLYLLGSSEPVNISFKEHQTLLIRAWFKHGIQSI